MRNYMIKALIEYYEEIYDEGQGKLIYEEWCNSSTTQHDGWMEAVAEFFSDELNFPDFQPTDVYIDENDDQILRYSFTVNNYSLPASPAEIAQWQAGKIKLMTCEVTMWIHERISLKIN